MLLLHHAKYHLSNAIHQMLSSSSCKVPAHCNWSNPFFIIMQKTIWLLRTSLDACCHLLLSIFVQALEQLGSSFDPTFTMGMPAFQPCTSQPDSHPNGGTWRPFDLNCATYNQLAAAAAAASSPLSANASSNSGSPSHITGWPRASSSMCFPDHAQEQFCH
jgi:hypothetical protein